MSAVPSTTTPARDSKLGSVLSRVAGGGAAAAALVAPTIAVWPASETDKVAELGDAAHDTRAHGYDAVSAQVSDQADALDRAANGYVGSLTSADDFEQAVYDAELDDALGDVDSQASDFRATGPEVQRAFWDGYETGLKGA
jgi:hypothetical protein